MLHNAVAAAYPFIVIFAQATADASYSWVLALLNYGALGVWVWWFIQRDKAEREAQERRHQENISAQKAVESAFRTNTNSLLVGMAAMKHLDATYTEILARVKSENDGGR